MGTSLLRVNDRHAEFNDSDLLVVARMVVSAIRNSDCQSLFAVAETWTRAIEGHAPGVVDLPVQEFASDAVVRQCLASLLDNLESSLSEWGDEVPLTYLKMNCQVPGVVFERPYPTHHLVGATRRLRELISHRG